MRLDLLRLNPYGPFSDTTIEFGDGLTVVHGVNEAGKSTLLAAYADLLCGITNPTPMNFLYGRPKLRIQAAATLDSGENVSVIRTSKNQPNDLIDARTEEPVAIDFREGLAEGLDQKNLLTRFGLNHDRLVHGGRDLMQGSGTLADIVFEARSGTDVRVLVDKLEKELSSLFGPKTTSAAKINRANASREGLMKSLKDTMATAEAVEAASARLKRKEDDLEQRRLEQARIQSERDRLDRLLGSWPYWEQYCTFQDELQTIEQLGPRLSSEQLITVSDAVERLEQIQDEIRQETAAGETAQRERSRLAVIDSLLAVQPAIDTLAAEQPNAAAAEAKAAQLQSQAANERETLSRHLGRLGFHDIEDPLSAAASVAIPHDRAADLNSLAETYDRLQNELDKEERAVAAAAAQLESALKPSDTGGAESLVSTREHRDALWNHVRLNWLEHADIPTDVGSSPANLAEKYVIAVGEADSAAEGLAIEAANSATVEERRQSLNQREQALTQVRQALTDWERSWIAASNAAGLPDGLGVPGWRERSAMLSEALDLAESVRSLDAQRSECVAVALAWTTSVQTLATSLEESIVPEHAAAWFDATKATYDESKENRKAAAVHLKREEEALQQVARLREERVALEGLLEAVATEHSVDRAGLSALVKRTETHAEVLAALASPEGQLRARHPDSALSQLSEEFATRDREQLSVDLESTKDALDTAEGVKRQAEEDAFSERKALEELTGRVGADSLQQDISQSTAHVLDLIEDYATTCIMHHLLTQELRAYFEAHKNPVLEEAGKYLSQLTHARYVALRADGEGTSRSLVVIGSDGTDYTTSDLSEGTASQLYLALNLAGVFEVQRERSDAGKERLPIMLDDVLMAFDDDRAECALELLAELGAEQQIVLFTHHEAVRDAAAALGKGVRVVTMDPPAAMN